MGADLTAPKGVPDPVRIDALIARARRKGVLLRVNGEGLEVNIRGSRPAELLDELKRHRRAVIAALRVADEVDALAAFCRGLDLKVCAGCAEAIGPDERTYDYYRVEDPKVSVARAHSEKPLCLIAWNERWHRAHGLEYEAERYRRLLQENR